MSMSIHWFGKDGMDWIIQFIVKGQLVEYSTRGLKVTQERKEQIYNDVLDRRYYGYGKSFVMAKKTMTHVKTIKTGRQLI